MEVRKASSLRSLSELKLSRAATESCRFFSLDELVKICRHRHHCTSGMSGDFLDEVQMRIQMAGFIRQDIDPVTFAYWRLYRATFDSNYMNGGLQHGLEILLSNETYEKLRKFTEPETKEVRRAANNVLTLEQWNVIKLRFGLERYILPMGNQETTKKLKMTKGEFLHHLQSGLKALKLPGALPRYSWLATYDEE